MKKILSALLTTALVSALHVAYAENSRQEYSLDLARQPLEATLTEFSKQTGLNTSFVRKTPDEEIIVVGPLKGRYTAEAALDALLAETGLSFRRTNDLSIAVTGARSPKSARRAAASAAKAAKAPKLLHLSERQVSSNARKNLSMREIALTDDITASARTADSGSKSSLDSLEEVVVTGTHIRGIGPVGSKVTVIDRKEIQSSGHGRLQDLLEALPQNFGGTNSEDSNLDFRTHNETRGAGVDLRGLGAGTTLILVNGRRQPAGGLEGAFVDISSIPTSAIERVEILADGASALYGSDAIGGVANFVLRKDFEGLETALRIGTTEEAANDVQASLLGGLNWTGGNLLVGMQYSHRDQLMAADTFYGSMGLDFRRLGGSDFRDARGNPGTILNSRRLPAFAIPANQDGTHLAVADLIPGQNFQDALTDVAILPEQKQYGVFLTFNQELNDRTSLFVEGRYNQREMTQYFGGNSWSAIVPASNPFYVNPFGTSGPVIVRYDFRRDMGTTAYVGDTDTYAITAGAIARLGSDWRMNVAASYGYERNDWEFQNTVNVFTIDAALADPNRATALNVFGDGANNNPATIDLIRSDTVGKGITTLRSATAIGDGSIFSLPAGRAMLAIGVDHRTERLVADSGLLGRAPVVQGFGYTAEEIRWRSPTSIGDIDRQVSAVFSELLLPILKTERVGARSLDLSLAGRYEDYSDFGSTFNPKIGFNYSPVDAVRFRGSWGTSFRAPRFNEISPFVNVSSERAQRVVDPMSATGFSDVLLLSGVVSDLQEETARVWSAGIDLDSEQLHGFSVSATYFDIDYRDKIQSPTPTETLNALLREDQFAEIITRNPTPAQIDAVCSSATFSGPCPLGIAAIIDARLRNIAVVRVEGVDFDLRYKTVSPFGEIRLSVAGTYTLQYERAITDAAAMIDVLDTVSNPLALRLRGMAGWMRAGWSANLAANYSDDYRDVILGRVDAWMTVDASVAYEFADSGWLNGLELQVSAINVFDEEPPFVNQRTGGPGYDAANANQSGRSLSIAVTKRF